MKYLKTVKAPETVKFIVDENINLSEFKSLMRELASTLNSKVEWIAMPEAEIGKIKLSAGEIYAKLDFDYGLELDCDGFKDHEILHIEEILSAR
ncbi:hypothetical protein [Telluria beijingensis]|uniref:hypothetical protein n=1 Tax=Telluria beijingensis TaxID=3068633 RepID=UPI0027959904|nr:hypothetical protein [Massilia sp. REN29]